MRQRTGTSKCFLFDKRDLEVYLPVNRRTIRSTGQRNAFKWTGTARVIFNLCSIASPLPGAPSMTLSPSPHRVAGSFRPLYIHRRCGRWRRSHPFSAPPYQTKWQHATAIDSDEIGFGHEDVATGR